MKIKIGNTVEVVEDGFSYMKGILHKHGIVKGYLRYRDGREMYLVDFNNVKDTLDSIVISGLHDGLFYYFKTLGTLEKIIGECLPNDTGRWYSPSGIRVVNNNVTFKMKGGNINGI